MNIKLNTESYLFENSEGQFRAIPFYELSIDEWVIFEKGKPKYFLDFNNRDKPLVKDINNKLKNGEVFEEIIWKLGRFLGREWTTKHNIIATEIANSEQSEIVELQILEDLSELFIDLIFVATDKIDFDELLNENRLFEKYITEDLGIESAYIDNFKNLKNLLNFIFNKDFELSEIASNEDKQIFDLTEYRNSCIKTKELEEKYNEWILLSKRENTMDEYGQLIGIISYITKKNDKNNLILITEKRKHYA
jgi:hypothetical protein